MQPTDVTCQRRRFVWTVPTACNTQHDDLLFSPTHFILRAWLLP